jgi:hypothetical protein
VTDLNPESSAYRRIVRQFDRATEKLDSFLHLVTPAREPTCST